jgi:heptosyltransferase-2
MDGEVINILENMLGKSIEVIQNKEIRAVASILSHMDLVVSNDTGIMHVAAAVGVPVISLFGPTDPYQWAPVGTRNRWIKSGGDDIAAITLDEVLQACRGVLESSRGST